MDRRRSSYASVAAGTAGSSSGQTPPARAGALSHMLSQGLPSASPLAQLQEPSGGNSGSNDPHDHPRGRAPAPSHHTAYDPHDTGAANVPASWGKSTALPGHWNLPPYHGGYGSQAGLGGHMFIRPSYLRGSRYMERLEAAHREKMAAQREATLGPGGGAGGPTATPGAGTASLSTSSSSVSLHRMAPSHRGMTYEIVEARPPAGGPGADDDGNGGSGAAAAAAPLPSKWAEVDRYGGLEVLPDGGGQDIKYAGAVKSLEHEAAAARTDHPMPPECGIYYYEVSVVSKGREGMIGVGFSGTKASLEKLPGWEPDSWAYHGDDGKSFCEHSTGKAYGPTFATGDTVGCGVNFRTRTAFFTKNGIHLGNAFRDLKNIKIYPSIGMKKPGAHITVNFGQAPFMYDINGMMMRERATVREEINAADVSSLYAPYSEAELIEQLVAQFLRHDGYVGSSKAFAKERRVRAAALKKEDKMPSNLEEQQDVDAINRQQIRAAILEGDIDRALKRTQACYPAVLRDNPRIYFRLRCRKFVEMMRLSTASAPPTPKSHHHSARMSNGKTAAATPATPATTASSSHPPDDVFEQDMELDEPSTGTASSGPSDDWDRMETEEELGTSPDGAAPVGLKSVGAPSSTGGGPKEYQDPMVEALRYAQELQTEFRDERSKEVTEALQEIFALFAYEDPRNSPLMQLMDPSGRASVAEELNSVILVSLGKSSSAAIERLCQQAEVLVSDISDHGGSGAFVNITGDILQ